MTTGYLSHAYAEALADFGSPLTLPRSGGNLLKRHIAGTCHCDAMGCYPMFCCRDWKQLPGDFQELAGELVCISLVTDPFGDYDESFLCRNFDKVIRFKEHYVVDLQEDIGSIVSKYSRKNARRALKAMTVEFCREPTVYLDDWVELYDCLISKHHIQGLRAFSKSSFLAQMNVPGLVMFRAVMNGKTAGAHLWYVQGEVAYSHLSAYSQEGYEHGAAYALQWQSLEYFADKVRWLNQGSGLSWDGSDGLSAFKKSWSNSTKPVYFCGKILNSQIYSDLQAKAPEPEADYFPVYRKGEYN